MKKLWLLLILWTLPAFANCKCCDAPITAPTKPYPCASGLFVTGDYLCWQAGINNPVFAEKVTGIDFENETIGKIVAEKLDFSWDSAFRVGVGYNFCYDAWDLIFRWTYYKTSTSNLIKTEEPELAFTFLGAQLIFFPSIQLSTEASAKLKFKYNAWDLDLGRDYYLGECFTVHPHFGLKGVWIKGRYISNYPELFQNIFNPPQDLTRVGFISLNADGKFWGLGPKLGAQGKWLWAFNFGLYGEVSGTLLWGRFEDRRLLIDLTFDLEPLAPINVNSMAPTVTPNNTRIRPMIEAQVGLDWKDWHYCNEVFLQITLGYEVQYFWKMNVLSATTDLNFKGLVLRVNVGY